MRSTLSISSILILLSGCGGGGSETGEVVSTQSVGSSNVVHTVSATPVTSTYEDELYQFSVSVNNPNNSKLAYRLVNAPGWLSIDDTGLVSGTPQTDADAGIYRDIKVQVTDDNQRIAELLPFSLTVTPVNDLPVIAFAQQRFVVDGRSNNTLTFTYQDEESSYPQSVQLSDASVNVVSVEMSSDTEIELTIADVEQVTDTSVAFEFFDGNKSVIKEVDFTIYPVSQSGLGRTLRGSRSGAGIHLVVLGDGYIDENADLFMQDAQTFNALFDQDPYIASHMSAWNIHMVFRASQEQGADEFHGVDTTETFFESGYSCADIERLICANTSKIFATALEEYPLVSQTVLVVNSDTFGGSGTDGVAIFNRTSPELALHELGHSFANLADEYVDESVADFYGQYYQQGAFANISNSNDLEDVPWAHWIEDTDNVATQSEEKEVGLFEGAFFHSEGFYRPVYDSVMRTAGMPFGVVNAEQWILSIYSEVGAVTEVVPSSSMVNVQANTLAQFSIEPLFGTPLQEITWLLDGVEITETRNQHAISLDLPVGSYQVEMQIKDVSGKIRHPSKDISSNFSQQWQLTVE